MNYPKKARNHLIELLRLVAAFGVINIHVHFDTRAAEGINQVFLPFCVPFFFLISLVYFYKNLRKATSVSSFLVKSLNRLVLPYLVWTLVYSGLLLAKPYLVQSSTHIGPWWRVFGYGESAVHLYFIPQLLNMQLALTGFVLLSRKGGPTRIIGASLILISGAYLYLGHYFNCFGVPSFLSVSCYLLAAVILSDIKTESRTIIGSFIGLGALLVITGLAISFLNVSGVARSIPFGGIGLVLLAMGFEQVSLSKSLLSLTSLSFGIYLSHVVFLEALETFFQKIVHMQVYYSLSTKLAVSFSVFLGSAVFVLACRRVPIVRRLLLGEAG